MTFLTSPSSFPRAGEERRFVSPFFSGRGDVFVKYFPQLFGGRVLRPPRLFSCFNFEECTSSSFCR